MNTNKEKALASCAAEVYRAGVKLQNIEADLIRIQCHEIAETCDEGAIKYYYRMAMHLEYMKFALAMNAGEMFAKHQCYFINQKENFELAYSDVCKFIQENA